LDSPDLYGVDRHHLPSADGELEAGAEALEHAGNPVITLQVADSYGVAAEFFRWEVAVAVACHVLGVNAFDQPDVQESKDRTRLKIAEFRSRQILAEGSWDISFRAAFLIRCRIRLRS
jgi:hypothetical protein